MTRSDPSVQQVLLDVDVDEARELEELDLALAGDRIASLQLSLELQRSYMDGLHQVQQSAAWSDLERDAALAQVAATRTAPQEAAAWAEAERDAALARLAELQAAFVADIAELAAANAELRQQVADAETARDLAASDLRSVLAVVELDLGLAEVAA